jgi:hypothetical protein
MLWAYFDESGFHDRASGKLLRLSFGGCMAPCESWSGFDAEWKEALESEHIDCFHMADFEAWRPPFDFKSEDGSRDHERHNRLLNDLLEIIARRSQWAFGFSRNVTIAGQTFRDTYEWCAIDTIMRLANGSAYRYEDEISVMFARHKDFAQQHLEGYFGLMNYGDARLRTIDTDVPSKLCQLQAADIIAYEVSRMERDGIPRRYPIKKLKELGVKFRFATAYP